MTDDKQGHGGMTNDSASPAPPTNPEPADGEQTKEELGQGHHGTKGWQIFVVRATSVITLVIKIIGVGMAGNEAFLVNPPRDPVVLGLAAFMMAGATGAENLIGNLLGGGKK